MKTYTLKDWERDGELNPTIGQEVEDAIYWDLLNSLPPACNRHNIFQAGEAYDHDWQTLAPLYTTLRRNEQGKWIYCGHCLLGKTEDKTEDGFGYMSWHN